MWRYHGMVLGWEELSLDSVRVGGVIMDSKGKSHMKLKKEIIVQLDQFEKAEWQCFLNLW